MSLSQRILAALFAGLATGILLGKLGGAVPEAVLPVARTIGSAWLGGLRMTIVPLVFVLLVTGVASAADAARAGGVAGRALLYFAIGLFASALVSGLVIEGALSVWPVPAGALASLGGAPGIPVGSTSISAEWLLSLIPVNPIKSAAEGEMVPVVLFALLFGFALTRIVVEHRASLLRTFSGISEALLVIVHWVLWLAPLGVFALAVVAGATAGIAAAGTLAHYIAMIVTACATVTLLVYPVVVIAGRIGLRRFITAALPAQAIALSTQSSIASLPAMIETVSGPLGVAEPVRNMVLPMAVSVFRVTSAAANLAVALYVAALHGIAIGPLEFMVGVLVATVVSLAAVGLPSQVSFFTAIGPVCLAMGVPVEVLPLLLAVETIPDIFRTVGNVTADMAVTRIIGVRSEVAQ
jgi:Na+/H+-dicarboxylate symporter